MIQIFDDYAGELEGGYFSSPKKNLGNKLFIYAACRIMADILDVNLISPETALIRREDNNTSKYVNQFFPFKGIYNRKEIKEPLKLISDNDSIHFKSIENLLNEYPNHGFINQSYWSKYDYIKPYKHMVKDYYKSLVLPQRTDNSIVIMLRDSRIDARFYINDDYYTDLLEKETFDKLYISLDHVDKHQGLLNKLEKYNPIILDGMILDIFSQVTSFKKIIAAQGTFSFWACLLSNADKIYWPITLDGPNSGNNTDNVIFNTYVNLVVDDENRYTLVNIK